VSGEVHRLPDVHYEGPNLDLPSPPADLPYEQLEDWRSTELLALNGIPATPDALLDALQTQSGVLLSAAAHACGSTGVDAAIPLLKQVARGADDYAGVEAAYALVRLGDDEGLPLLHEALKRPVGAYLSPILAAGYLAQLGDPAGYAVVREALGSEFLAARMLACKQLYFFAALHGSGVDALGLFKQALDDEDPTVKAQALGQLRRLRWDEAEPLLED
jgi:HEAT repeat protein